MPTSDGWWQLLPIWEPDQDPARLHGWLRRIDRWIAYANSVVEE